MKTILDLFEYSSDVNAQAAYVTSSIASEIVDQQQTSYDDEITLGDAAGTEYREAQGFQLSGTYTVTAIEIRQDHTQTGTPTGNWTLRIETDNSGKPSGTLANINSSVIVSPPGINTIVKGIFSIPFTLNASTIYWVVISCDNQSTGNAWRLSFNTTGGYSNGLMVYNSDAGDWTTMSGWDLYFKIYVQGEKSLQSYSEPTIKTQGSYSLKGIASITDSLNKTLTRTIGSTIDLIGISQVKFDIYSNRTGSNIKIGLHDSGGVTTEITPNILSSNTWQEVKINLKNVINANKDAIDSIIITIVNSAAANTFYIDNLFGYYIPNVMFVN
jgi:hypothetical protein